MLLNVLFKAATTASSRLMPAAIKNGQIEPNSFLLRLNNGFPAGHHNVHELIGFR